MASLFIKRLGTLLFICVSVISCKENREPVFRQEAVRSNVAPEQSSMLGALLQDYLNLKDALVNTKSDEVHKSAVSMLENLKILTNDTKAVADQGRLHLNITVQTDSIRLQLTNIISNKDKSCEPQRIYFKYLSDNIYKLIKAYGITNTRLYSYFCPMAMNGKGGAWWLSNSRKVKNPYFGSKMLTCGELVDTLK